MSKTRMVYMGRLVLRCLIFILVLFLCVYKIEEFNIIEGMNFFKEFSFLHILWGLWMIDIFAQLVPVKAFISIGSHKQFKEKFKKSDVKIEEDKIKGFVKKTNLAALRVFVIWAMVICIIGALHLARFIKSHVMIAISVFFYVCDLICVLVWCPFRLIMGNRCCTTCRIFNWDHIMMFGNLGFVEGFFSKSLFLMGLFVFVVWEIKFYRHPERFCDVTNANLTCRECTDKLCTQYCKKKQKRT